MRKKIVSMVLEDVGKIALKEFPAPSIGADEGLLAVEMAGVCGTDYKFYRGKYEKRRLPIVLGHEILGRIEEIGDAAAKGYGVKPGDRVVVESSIRCNACWYCINGDYGLCDTRRSYGTSVSASVPPHIWGAYGTHMYLAQGSVVHKIAETVPAEAAVLTCAVIANGINWVNRLGGAKPGDVVLIQGVGQQGLAAIIAARESGASKIIATGLSRDAERFELAKLFGADQIIDVERQDPFEAVRELTGGRMADVAVDVTGSPKAIAASINLVRRGGTVVASGLTGTGVQTPIEIDTIVMKQIKIQGTFAHHIRAVIPAIKLIESGKYPVEKMVSHKFKLREAEKAIQAAGGELPGTYPVKVALMPVI